MAGKDKERPVAATGAKRSGGKSKEHPLAVFSRLLKDFEGNLRSMQSALSRKADKGGNVPQPVRPVSPAARITRLSRVAERNVAAPSRNVIATSQRSVGKNLERIADKYNQKVPSSLENVQIPGQSKERIIVKPGKSAVSTKTTNNTVNRVIRAPAATPRANKTVNRDNWSSHTHNYPAVTGADREAQLRFASAHPSDSPYRVPSAARLAQVLRADELIKAGDLPKNKQVHEWAKQIRSGQRRRVADLDPGSVQKVLHSVTGGAHKAKQLLSTPSVNKLVERHETTLKTLERSIQDVGKAAQGSKSVVATATNPHQPTPNRTKPHQPAVRGSRAQVPKPPSGATQEAELTQMVATNEEPHDRALADHVSRGVSATGRAAQSAESTRAQSQAVAALRSPINRSRAVGGITAPAKATTAPTRSMERTIPTGVSAPDKAKIKASSEPVVKDAAAGAGRRQEISGTMELTMNGQKAGQATFNGELT